MKKHIAIPLIVLVAFLMGHCTPEPQMEGELKKWHKITLTFDGPQCDELGEVNPFTDYRMEVTFTSGDHTFKVPGYFAADGNAAYSSATSGNKWRVHFTPNTVGEWTYEVSFRMGSGISISEETGEPGGYPDGTSGSFHVLESDKTGRDFRAHGRLRYVGEHYLQFEGTKQYFLKCGADAPENFLAFYEFDNTPNVGGRLKYWADHAQDFNGDANSFLWGANMDKGKNILGAINYLSSVGMNAFSFLTFNIDGDDRNVFPHLLNTDLDTYTLAAEKKENPIQWEEHTIHNRFDVSKLDQWEQVFAYGEMKGMFLHFKTMENENDQKMDGGELGSELKLYYRELIARFGHHLALNWNVCEETTRTDQQHNDIMAYINALDPYKHLIVLHTYPDQHEKMYQPLLGQASALSGLSIQTDLADFSLVHKAVDKWVKASAEAGKKWAVAVDEPGDAMHALVPDSEDSVHNDARINGLWGALMAGAWGTEWYFGYSHPESDLTCQSWRSRELFWKQGRIALDFFNNFEIPFWQMSCMDEMTASEDDYVFAKEGEVYLIYSKAGGEIDVQLPDVGYRAMWFNPRTGQSSEAENIATERQVSLQTPTMEDWLLYMRK